MADEGMIRERAYHLWEKEGCPGGRDLEFWERARLLQEAGDRPAPPPTVGEDDRELDEALDESFPASDPPAYTGAGTVKDGTA